MKKTILALAAAAVLPLFAAETSVKLDSGKDFSVVNDYGKTVQIRFEKFLNKQAVVIRGLEKRPKKDTAFSLKVKPFAVAGKKQLKVTVDAAATVPQLAGRDMWCCRINWFDKAGKQVSATPMAVKFDKKAYKANTFAFPVPANAAQAQIQLGNDTPDLEKNDFVAFSKIAYDLN